MPRFDKTSCSQCGGEFGPGDQGYSHCSDHATAWHDSETAPEDEATCPQCEGDGGDKWNDYCLPCPLCGGDGRLW